MSVSCSFPFIHANLFLKPRTSKVTPPKKAKKNHKMHIAMEHAIKLTL